MTEFPAILGCDAAGIVHEVGANLKSKFAPGARVVGSANVLQGYKYSAFQEYTVLQYPYVIKVPDKVELTDAVVLPVGINTASTCLFDKSTLELQLPGSNGGNGETVIIWGASSSIGACGVQLAAAAGYEVMAIASAKNHGLAKSLGASECFDYNDPDVVKKAVKALADKKVVGAFDCISNEDTSHTLCDILNGCDGRRLVVGVSPMSPGFSKDGVEVKANFGSDMKSKAFVTVWQDYLANALASGKFQCKPDPEICGNGLEKVQPALDRLAEGVSAKKLVITL